MPSPHHPKIYILLPAMNDGGAERAFINLANEMHARKSAHIEFLLIKKEGVYLDIVDPGIAVRELYKGDEPLFSFPSLIKVLKTEQPDLLISSLPIADLLAIWARMWLGRKAPRHMIATQNMRADQFKGYKALRSRIKALCMLFFYRRADLFAAVSQAVASELQTLFDVPHKKIRVIPNSVDLAHIQKQRNAKPDHPWLEEGRDYKVLIAVGRLVAQKDYPTLIKAFKNVQGKKDARLIILGEGPERETLQKMIDEEGLGNKIDLAGFRKNPFALVAASDAFVLSSAWEGFGNVIIEALSVGTPVIATRCPGAPREILDEGTFGHLADVKDPEHLAEKILKSLDGDHPEKEVLMKRASEYSIEAVTDLYDAYFREIIDAA